MTKKMNCKAYFFISFLAMFASCKPKFNLSKDNIFPIESSFEGEFENSYHLHLYSDFNFNTPLQIFYIDDAVSDSFGLSFLDEYTLVISYTNVSGEVIEKTFPGKFSKKGYFEIFHSKSKILLSPFYFKDDKDRVRISLNQEGNLVLDYYYKEGTTFIVGYLRYINEELITRDANRGQEVGIVKQKEQSFFD